MPLSSQALHDGKIKQLVQIKPQRRAALPRVLAADFNVEFHRPGPWGMAA